MKIVIIGGGIAGLSVGWRLAKAGCQVEVLERAQPGRAATWASAGMIAATVEGVHGGRALGGFGRRSAELWPAFAAEIEAASGRPVFYRRDGALMAVPSPIALENLAQIVTGNVSVLSAAETLALEPMIRDDIAGALYAHDDAQVDNRAIGTALAAAFLAAGGSLQLHEAAVRLECENGRVEGVRTPFAFHEADAYVVAAGAWSSQIEGARLPEIVPVKGEIVALAPPAGAPLPTRIVWGNEVYVVPRHDRLFIGATTARIGFDTTPTEAARDRLLGKAVDLMPTLAAWTLSEQWAGLRPGTPDDLPLIGESGIAGLYLATGQFRNGILFAPAIADAMHSLIVEHRAPPDISAFDPQRLAGKALEDGTQLH